MFLVQIVLLILGIVYLFRRPKYSRLTPGDFPHVYEGDFHKWRRLEIISIDVFLWATWGVFVVSIIYYALTFRSYYDIENILAAQLVFSGIFLVGLIISAIFGSQAAGIRKREGIDSPLSVQQYARPVKGSAKDFLPPLIDMLKDPEKRVRELTIERLAEMGSTARRALPALRKVAQYDKEESVRELAKDAIGKIYTGR